MAAVPVEAIRCPVCDELVADDELDEHVRSWHVEDKDKVDAFGCIECGEVFDDEAEADECHPAAGAVPA